MQSLFDIRERGLLGRYNRYTRTSSFSFLLLGAGGRGLEVEAEEWELLDAGLVESRRAVGSYQGSSSSSVPRRRRRRQD